jgi:hypothetical protein
MITDIKLQNNTGSQIAIGAMEPDYVLESVDWGVAAVSTGTIFYFPTKDTEQPLYQEWKPRDVSIIGWVIGNSENAIKTKCDTLDAFVGLQEEIKLLYNGYYLTFYTTANVLFANEEVDNNEVLCKFSITGVCLDPLWYNTNLSVQGTGLKVPMFTFPMIFNQENATINFGRQYGADDVHLTYDGISSTGIIMTLISAGAISDLTIIAENGNTVQTFTLTGNYSANTEIKIDTREGFQNVTANGVNVTASVADGSDWFRLTNGATAFLFEYTGNEQINANITVKNDPVYEVQI